MMRRPFPMSETRLYAKSLAPLNTHKCTDLVGVREQAKASPSYFFFGSGPSFGYVTRSLETKEAIQGDTQALQALQALKASRGS
jgi:hypothetical protein